MFKNIELKYGVNRLSDSMQENVLMDIFVYKGRIGEFLTILEEHKESSILLLQGEIEVSLSNEIFRFSRINVFEEEASCIHIPRNTKISIMCKSEVEFLIQQTNNESDFKSKIYEKKDIIKQTFGVGTLASTTQRIVTTVFDFESAPESNMVLGEIINKPGIWSSYPPHHHPQPEVYFYKFNKKQGFGTCYIGEECYKVNNNSVALIPGGYVHPQNAAPGYAMYYVWMIRHLPNHPWRKDRITESKHEWLLDENVEIIKL